MKQDNSVMLTGVVLIIGWAFFAGLFLKLCH